MSLLIDLLKGRVREAQEDARAKYRRLLRVESPTDEEVADLEQAAALLGKTDADIEADLQAIQKAAQLQQLIDTKSRAAADLASRTPSEAAIAKMQAECDALQATVTKAREQRAHLAKFGIGNAEGDQLERLKAKHPDAF